MIGGLHGISLVRIPSALCFYHYLPFATRTVCFPPAVLRVLTWANRWTAKLISIPQQQLSAFPFLQVHCETAVLCWSRLLPSPSNACQFPLLRVSFSLPPPNPTCSLVDFPGQTLRPSRGWLALLSPARIPVFRLLLQDRIQFSSKAVSCSFASQYPRKENHRHHHHHYHHLYPSSFLPGLNKQIPF